MRFGRGATLLAAAVMASGLAGCGGGDEPTEPSTTVSPRTPDDQSKTSDASQGETSEASGSESSGESTDESSSSSGERGGVSDSSPGAGELPEDMPAVATKRTKEGAAAFGKYYYDAFGDAVHTGDVSVIDWMSQDDCPPCREAIKGISSDREKGRGADRDPYTESHVSAKKRPDRGYKVAMDVDVSAYKVVEGGKDVGHVRAQQYRLTEHVIWSEGRWFIADWALS